MSLFNLLTFVIPALMFIEFNVLGRIFLTDLLLISLFPFLVFFNPSPLTERLPKLFVVLGVMWLFGLVFSDMYRNTPAHDYLRGWAKVIVTLLNFCTIYLLVRQRQLRIILFSLGIIIGTLFTFFLFPSEYAQKEPWKFGLAFPTTLLLMLTTTAFGYHTRIDRLKIYGIILFAALLNIYFGFRSLSGICVLTLIYLFVAVRKGSSPRSTRQSALRIFLIAVFLIASGILLLKVYEYAAQSGYLGQASKAKLDVQSGGKYGLFLGGRSEILISSKAIADSPIIGHGSWAKDDKYVTEFLNMKSELGYLPGYMDTDLIPTHSHLFGAWVEAGILGGIFWLWVLSLPLRTLRGLIGSSYRLLPLVVFIALTLIWDILFSPYGAERRFLTPFYIVVMMTFIVSGKRR